MDNNLNSYGNFAIEITFPDSVGESGYYAVPTNVEPLDDGYAMHMGESVPEGYLYLDDDYDNAYRILAVRLHRDEWVYEASVYDRDHTVTLGNKEWLVLTDSEADDAWEKELDNYIDDCLEIPEAVKPYFDREKFKDDARRRGRGHALNHYDGEEVEVKTEIGTYYLYRKN